MKLIFDIGGSKMRLALAPDAEKFDSPQVEPTPASVDEALERLKNFVAGQKLDRVIGGIAGTWDRDRSQLLASPHLSGWVGQPIAAQLASLFNCPVLLENDTALVGLGEAVAGAGQGYGLVAYLTISTGVGGARLVNGVIDEHNSSFEPGHQLIEWQGERRQIESLISGSAVKAETGQEPFEISDAEFWAERSRRAALLVHNTCQYWTPDVVVLGGSMMKTPGLKLEIIQAELKKLNLETASLPELKLATLGDFGGLYGALAYGRQKAA